MRAHGERSSRHVQFGAGADLIIVQGCGPLDRDVHLKPMLLAQNKDLLQRERLNAWRRKPEGERNRRGDLRPNPRVNGSPRGQLGPPCVLASSPLIVGPAGSERPGVLDSNGDLRELGPLIRDIDQTALSPEGLAFLRALDPLRLPLVAGSHRLSSDSVVGQRMAISFTVELHDGLMDRVIEVFGAREGLVSELVSLQVAPELFDVVELRSVFGQPLDPEPVGTFGKSRLASLAGMDRAVVEDEHDRLERDPELGPEAPVNLLQESDEVRTALGARGLHDQVARRPVEKAEHRDLLALARGRNAQIGSLLGPDMRQVGMGQRFGLVLEQQDDVARLGLRFEQLPAQTGAVHRVRILAALQRVTRPPPAKPPFFRSTTESREREMRRPERCSISLAKRGSV